jgi:hypothetical protein
MVGRVLYITKLGTPEHDAESDNDTDDIHVDFMTFDYPDERVQEIEAMLSDLYDEPKSIEDAPLDDAIMAPDMLICITDISCEDLEGILASEDRAAGYYAGIMAGVEKTPSAPVAEHELQRRLGVVSKDAAGAFLDGDTTTSVPQGKGYLIAVSDGEGYIDEALHIERDDSLYLYPDDATAAKAAEADGIALIYGMSGVSDGTYIDTQENRAVIAEALEVQRLSRPADAESLRRLRARLDEGFADFRARLLRRSSKEDIFDGAAEIARLKEAYDYFRVEHVFTIAQTELLAQHHDPLGALAEIRGQKSTGRQHGVLDGSGLKPLAEHGLPAVKADMQQKAEPRSFREWKERGHEEARHQPSLSKKNRGLEL